MEQIPSPAFLLQMSWDTSCMSHINNSDLLKSDCQLQLHPHVLACLLVLLVQRSLEHGCKPSLVFFEQ